MSNVTLNINRRKYTVDVDPQMPLLWVIRDYIGLTGTKYGCGIAQCGACTVHVDSNPIRSCVLSVESAKNKKITTIEGISENNDHLVQKAWIEEQVPQCGYCHSGQIMAAVALLEGDAKPDEEKIQRAMDGILCRCGTYPRIKKALDRLIKDIEL
jgi:isoquinoline 1-oxidoreductase alpha subunit